MFAAVILFLNMICELIDLHFVQQCLLDPSLSNVVGIFPIITNRSYKLYINKNLFENIMQHSGKRKNLNIKVNKNQKQQHFCRTRSKNTFETRTYRQSRFKIFF